ncbi:GAD-like domain-containing protein [Deinococcus aquatilis]|uniref:GAD-like domain-containing protein n=1 Tax=Deinococcus aquatilis TaxID=519440 RepID=UPI00036D0C4F|nr:GAD-like domain-containing protein [Deinococcus aquatilis]
MYEQVDLLRYELLEERFGSEKYADVTLETLEKYQGKVPELLLAIWERYGLTSHGQGELWFTNPDDFTDIVQAFFGDQHPFIVYARTSFGRLWAILDDRLYTIHPQIACAIYGHKLEVFDTLMSSGLVSTSSDFHTEHLKALKKLGPLKADQMYGYVPVLALGGNGSLKETKIVQMREYLFMVADIATTARREGWNPLGLPTESSS